MTTICMKDDDDDENNNISTVYLTVDKYSRYNIHSLTCMTGYT